MHSSETERQILTERIYNINEKNFGTVAIEVWKYQYRYNDLYRSYCALPGIMPAKITDILQIPFLPIEMYGRHKVMSGDWEVETIFKSSGTTGSTSNLHYVRSLHWYHRLAEKGFTHFYKDPKKYVWLGLLPSYLERQDSSLVDMVNYFMQKNVRTENKFYPVINHEIIDALRELKLKNQATILFGVSFAILDLFEQYEVPAWENLLVMETGGMKGRRSELTREELYSRIKKNYPVLNVNSEYGMTELTSQAYKKDIYFQAAPTMKVMARDISDPLKINGYGQRGALNIIDLGNLDTCAFIATDDIGTVYPDGSFDVFGRLDRSDVRGCNLMYS